MKRSGPKLQQGVHTIPDSSCGAAKTISDGAFVHSKHWFRCSFCGYFRFLFSEAMLRSCDVRSHGAEQRHQNLSDRRRFTFQIEVAQPSFWHKTYAEIWVLCVNQRPIRYEFRTSTKIIRYRVDNLCNTIDNLRPDWKSDEQIVQDQKHVLNSNSILT